MRTTLHITPNSIVCLAESSVVKLVKLQTETSDLSQFAGTFEQLVLTDSLSALIASPPLLYVTNARRFTDWRLVVTAVTFQVCVQITPHAIINWQLQCLM